MPRIKVKCACKTDLLMNRMTDETLEGLRTGVHPNKPKDRPKLEVAKEQIYREQYADGNGTPDGRIGFPPENVFACLKIAGCDVKNGKKNISKAGGKVTTLPGLMSIEETFIPLTHINGDKAEHEYWTVDTRRGRLKDGTAICLVRPRFKGWTFEFTIEYDKTKINETVLKKLVEVAGSMHGLGAFRPNCGGPFGRFDVVGWEVTEGK